METIRISNDRLKIMLSPEDMARYQLDRSSLDYDSEQTRKILRRILEEVGRDVDFDAVPGRLYLQIYESRAGGCEMFVTRLDQEIVEEEPTGQQYFRFPDLNTLFMLCRRLHDCPFDKKTTLLYGENRWYLGFPDGDSPFVIYDYGTLLDEAGVTYIAEYTTTLLQDHAVEQLSSMLG